MMNVRRNIIVSLVFLLVPITFVSAQITTRPQLLGPQLQEAIRRQKYEEDEYKKRSAEDVLNLTVLGCGTAGAVCAPFFIIDGEEKLPLPPSAETPIQSGVFKLQEPIPPGVQIKMVSNGNGTYSGSFIAPNGNTYIFGTVDAPASSASINRALQVMEKTGKQAPYIADLLGRPLPSGLTVNTNAAGVGGNFSKSRQLINIMPNTGGLNMMHQTLPHELTHWISQDAICDLFCETMSQMVERRYLGVARPPAYLPEFAVNMQEMGDGYFRAILRENMINPYSPLHGVNNVGSAAKPDYILSSLLADELALRIGPSDPDLLKKIQGLLDKARSSAESGGVWDEPAKALGFKDFEDMAVKLEARYKAGGGVPVVVPVAPEAAKIMGMAKAGSKALGVVGAVATAYDLIVINNAEHAQTEYIAALKRCETLRTSSVWSAFWGRIKQAGVTIGINTGLDDMAGFLLDGITKGNFSEDLKRELQDGVAYIQKNCPSVLRELKADPKFIDGLNDIGVRTVANPRVLEMGQAPDNWWLPQAAPATSPYDRSGPAGSGFKYK